MPHSNLGNYKTPKAVEAISKIYRRRSSSVHLEAAESFLELRAKVIGSYQNVQRRKSRAGYLKSSTDKEQYTNVLTGEFYMGKQTVYSINCHTKNSGFTTTVKAADLSGLYNHRKSSADRKKSISNLRKLFLNHAHVLKNSENRKSQPRQILPPIDKLIKPYSMNTKHEKVELNDQDSEVSTWKPGSESKNFENKIPDTKISDYQATTTSTVDVKSTYQNRIKDDENKIMESNGARGNMFKMTMPCDKMISSLDVLPDINRSDTAGKLLCNYAIEVDSKVKPERQSDLGLVVASASTANPSYTPTKEMSKVAMRKEYSKNLEQNWYRSFIGKAKEKSHNADKFDINLDFFYSPEPDSSDISGDEKDEIDTKSILISEYNHEYEPEQLQECDKENKADYKDQVEVNLKHFSSTNVLTGEDGELDRATPSEIEIVLKNNQLIQKHTKYKMRKKRQRKQDLYENLNTEKNNSDVPVLSDTELRALRLGLKKKQPKLKGKKRFIQMVNMIIIVNHFSKVLSRLRISKKKRKKKQKKIAYKPPSDKTCEEDVCVPSPSLAEKFMADFGKTLLKDVQKLNGVLESTTGYIIDAENCKEINQGTCPGFTSTFRLCSIKDIEKCELGLRKCNLGRRRLSEPVTIGSVDFTIELSEKPRRRRHRTSKMIKGHGKKSKSRNASLGAVKCGCNKNTEAVSASSRKARQSSSVCLQHFTRDGNVSKKTNSVIFRKDEVLKRRPSLNDYDLKFGKEIPLIDLLQGICMPAKDIRIQIIKRKLQKQKKRKQRLSIPPIISCSPKVEQTSENDDNIEDISLNADENTCDDEIDSDLDNTRPLVSAGISWNKQSRRSPRWTSEDVEREMGKVSQLFMEMKDCTYIRWTSFHQAVIEMMRENEY